MKLLILPLAAAMALASCATPAAPASDVAVSGAKPGKATAPKPKPYPLKKCLVTGDDLDEFEERVSVVHGGQTYEFCCKPCLKKFRENPRKFERALAKAR